MPNIFFVSSYIKIIQSIFIGLSFSKIQMEKGGVIESSQCFTNEDCIRYAPFLKCGNLGVVCKDGACVCKKKTM